MIRQVAAAVIVAGFAVAPLSAELKYTMRVESRPSKVASPAPANPLFGLIGGLVVGTIAPAGGLGMTTVVGDRGARIEYDRAYTVVPAGGAMIIAPDGSVVVINPAARTFWRMQRPPGAAMAGSVTPVVKVVRTGAFETIAGVRAEHATIEIRMALPLSAGAAMPGLPSDIAITGETWLTDQYKKYTTLSAGLSALTGPLGPDTLASSGFPMRSVMRSDLFAGQEIESVVTSIGEIPSPAGAFEVPAGFTEVAPPQMGLPQMGAAR